LGSSDRSGQSSGIVPGSSRADANPRHGDWRTYDDFDDVIAACNTSRYGLQAGLFTHDLGRVLTAWRELEVGGLVVNGSSNFRLDHVPFGGVKDSGFGRESPGPMIEDLTVVRTMLIRGMSIWGEER